MAETAMPRFGSRQGGIISIDVIRNARQSDRHPHSIIPLPTYLLGDLSVSAVRRRFVLAGHAIAGSRIG